MPAADELKALVSAGRVDRRLYTDPEIFEIEMERIFGRAWIFVGHDSQLRDVGDFVTARVGRERIIVVRHEDRAVHAFYNRCAHRGAEVCPASSGNTRSFTCPYHAWTYRTDGSLESVPLAAGYADGLEPRKGELGLEPVARIARYRGFLFANRSRNGVGLEEFLGPDVRAAFDNFVDRAPGGEVVQAGGKTVQRYRANWKLQIENSIDLLHPSILHHNAVDCADRLPDEAVNEASDVEVALTRSNGLSPAQWDEMRTAALPRGHCWMGGFIGDVAKEESTGAAVGWQRDYRAALARRHGEAKAKAVLDFSRHNTIVYPNLFVNPQLGQIRILQPVAVDCTEQHGYLFKLGGAPEELYRAAVRALNLVNSPSSIITTDDHEVFERIQEALAYGDRAWVDWTRGFDGSRVAETAIPSHGANEILMRNQHDAWLAYMSGEA